MLGMTLGGDGGLGVRWYKRAIAVAERGPHTPVAKTNNVRKPAVGQLGEAPRMLIHAPSLFVAKAVEDGILCGS
jgi:hypothetical protein